MRALIWLIGSTYLSFDDDDTLFALGKNFLVGWGDVVDGGGGIRIRNLLESLTQAIDEALVRLDVLRQDPPRLQLRFNIRDVVSALP